MTYIDELIVAINKINKEIKATEKAEINSANIKELEKYEKELDALKRKLQFAAEDLARAAQIAAEEI